MSNTFIEKWNSTSLTRAITTQFISKDECLESRKSFLRKQIIHTGSTHVHGDSADFGPTVPLHLVLVVGTTGLQQRLVNPTPASYYPNQGSAC